MKEKKAIYFLLSIGSLPIAWGVFQGYHFFVSKPFVEWILSTFPQFCETFHNPFPFVTSLLNLALFGTMAMVWPHLGFGHAWSPNRQHGFVVLTLIVASLIFPMLHEFGVSGNPFKAMGSVIWTITPVQEEIFFRGFLYAFLLRFFHRSPESSWREILPVLVLGAVWFSLWHLSPHAITKYGWRVVGTQAVFTFLGGLLFNGLRHWTGSIWLVIPVHAAGNFMVSLM